jgi:hypothetical protein
VFWHRLSGDFAGLTSQQIAPYLVMNQINADPGIGRRSQTFRDLVLLMGLQSGFEARRGTEDIAGNCHQAAGHWHLSKAESEDDGKHREGRHHGSPWRGFRSASHRRVAGKKTQAISLTRVRTPPHGRVEKGPGPGRPACRPRYFFRGGADGGGAGGTSSPRPPKMSCFQRSKRESGILTRCVFSGPISCAAITLPSGLATPSPLA